MIYPSILFVELQSAGISITGCDSNGVVFAVDGKQIQARTDVAAVIAAHQAYPYNVDSFGQPISSEIVFAVPVRAPDFVVSSPKPKDDPLEAIVEAVAEGGKAKKSIALMVLNFAKYLDDVEKRLKKAKV
jgi:hypothetical protein